MQELRDDDEDNIADTQTKRTEKMTDEADVVTVSAIEPPSADMVGDGDDDMMNVPTEKERMDEEMADETNIMWLGFFSFMFLIIVSYDCENENDDNTDDGCNKQLGFAVFVAVATEAFILIHFLTAKIPFLRSVCILYTLVVEPCLNVVLFVFWASATIVLTMPEKNSIDRLTPYTSANGGWLMVWCAALTSVQIVYPNLRPAWTSCVRWCPGLKMMGTADERSTAILVSKICLNLAVLWTSVYNCSLNTVDCDGSNGWAVVCPLLSVAFCLILFLFGKCFHMMQNHVLRVLYVALTIWWLFGVIFITVKGPVPAVST
eukprot:g2514.t1